MPDLHILYFHGDEMERVDVRAFIALRENIESHPRLFGYYIIKLIDITELRKAGASEEEIAEEVFQQFDDKDWPPIEQRPQDESWADYLTDGTAARLHVIETLMGGPSIGHLEVTISEQQSTDYFDQFDRLFAEPKQYYMGMGFGDPAQVFSGGIAIIGPFHAGCLWVIEND